MPDNTEEKKKPNLYVVLAVVASLVLARSGFGFFVFCIPLLLTAQTFEKPFYSSLCFVSVGIAVMVSIGFEYRSLLRNSTDLGIVLMSIVFPLMTVTGCAVWAGLRNYSSNVLRKLVICSYAVGFIGIVFAVWFSCFAEDVQVDALLEVYRRLIPSDIFGDAADTVVKLVLSVMLLMMVPFGIVFSSFQILISEFILHKSDEKWQCGFAYMKMPDNYVWAFIGLWAAALGCRFLTFLPEWVFVVLWNTACALSLHYFTGGISIVTSVLRRRSATVTAGKVFFPVAVCCLIPFVNLIVFAGLTVLGVSETWIKMR